MSKKNIVDLANAVAQENNVEDVIWILEQSFVSATMGYYGDVNYIHVIMHPISEEPTWLHWKGEEPIDQDSLKNVLTLVKSTLERKEELDKNLWEILPPVPVDRNMAQKISKDFKRNIDNVKKTQEYEMYQDKVGIIVSGIIHSIDVRGNAIVTFDNVQGYLPYRELIKKEPISVAKRIRCVIQSVESDPKKHQITLSRASPLFFEALFEQVVPEIASGLIIVNKIVREPGGCTKVAVSSSEYNFDAVLTCIGARGVRIQTIIQELGGEKVHVVAYDPDILNLAVNTLNISEIIEAYVEEEERPAHSYEESEYDRYTIVTIVVPDELKSRAIGSSGQNVRLVSKMIGCRVDILSKTEFDTTKKQKNGDSYQEKTDHSIENDNKEHIIIMLMNKLDIDYDLSDILVNQLELDNLKKILDMSIDNTEELYNIDLDTVLFLKKQAQNVLNEEGSMAA